MTSDDIQKYVRIVLQWLAAYLVTRGAIDQNATWVQPAIGLGVGIATFAWTVWGNRLYAKLVSVDQIPGTKVVVDASVAPAGAIKAAADPAVPNVTLK